MNEIVIARIRHCLKKLEDPSTKQSDRLAYCRQLISAAQDAHEKEVQLMDALKVPVSDDAVRAITGGPVD